MTIGCQQDLAGLRRAGRVVSEALGVMRAAVAPGLTTAALDAIGARILRERGARSAPQLVYGFPGVTCISVNDEVVHGVPGPRVLGPGDVVKIDVTVELDGFVADAAATVLMPPVSRAAHAMVRCARAAFEHALAAARPGRPVSTIGEAVETEVRRRGFFVLRELTGHGVGKSIHEAPAVPNFADPLATDELHAGLVLAVEPIITPEPTRTRKAPDGWTLCTRTGCIAVHHEHTIVVQDGPPLVLTR